MMLIVDFWATDEALSEQITPYPTRALIVSALTPHGAWARATRGRGNGYARSAPPLVLLEPSEA